MQGSGNKCSLILQWRAMKFTEFVIKRCNILENQNIKIKERERKPGYLLNLLLKTITTRCKFEWSISNTSWALKSPCWTIGNNYHRHWTGRTRELTIVSSFKCVHGRVTLMSSTGSPSPVAKCCAPQRLSLRTFLFFNTSRFYLFCFILTITFKICMCKVYMLLCLYIIKTLLTWL